LANGAAKAMNPDILRTKRGIIAKDLAAKPLPTRRPQGDQSRVPYTPQIELSILHCVQYSDLIPVSLNIVGLDISAGYDTGRKRSASRGNADTTWRESEYTRSKRDSLCSWFEKGRGEEPSLCGEAAST